MITYTEYAADTTDQIIGCAIEVHRHLGPGLLESVYESARCLELKAAGLPFARQVGVPLLYKGELIAEHRPDLVVSERVIVEVESVERFNPVFLAQMLTYLQLVDDGARSTSGQSASVKTLRLCVSEARHRGPVRVFPTT